MCLVKRVSDLCVDQRYADHVIVKKHAALPSEIIQLLEKQHRRHTIHYTVMQNLQRPFECSYLQQKFISVVIFDSALTAGDCGQVSEPHTWDPVLIIGRL